MWLLDRLQELPLWAAGLVIIGATTLLALLAIELVERTAPRPARRGGNDLAGVLIAVVGALYAVPLGLIAVEAWDDFGEARSAVHREVSALAHLAVRADGLEADERTTLLAALHDYARAVADKEWPEMAAGQKPHGAEAAGLRLRKTVMADTAGDLRPVLEEIYSARLDRVLAAEDRLIPAVWLLVVAGAAATLLFAGCFVVENRAMHRGYGVLLANTIALVMILIVAVDRPFFGHAQIGPEPFVELATERFAGALDVAVAR
jgi:hypothetical protein